MGTPDLNDTEHITLHEKSMIGGEPESHHKDNLPHVLRQRRRQFMHDMINEVGRYITSILDLDTLLWEVTRYTSEVFNAYGTAVGLIEGEEIVLRIGVGQSGRHDIVRLPLRGTSAAAIACANSQGVIVNDTRDLPDFQPFEALPDVMSEMAIPVITHNEQVIGVLLAFSDEINAFDDEFLKLLEMLAEHVAVAVINARLLAKQQVETWGSAVLLRVARMLSGIRHTQDLIYAVLGLALDLTGAEHGALLTFEEVGDGSDVRHIFTSNETIQGVVESLGSDWEGDLIRRLEPLDQLQISYAHYASAELEPLMSHLEIEVAMLAPIRVEDRIWGTLILGYASAHRFTRYDFNLIAGLAAQAAAAIENARLIKQVEEEQSYLQAVIANTREGLFLVDPDGRMSYANSRLEELLGVKAQEFMQESYQRLFDEIASFSENPPDTIEQLAQSLDNLNQQPTIYLLTNSPTIFRLQISLFPILDERTSAIGWGGIVRDVTAEWNEITQRTEHLAAITHELRTSLATMKGFVTTLLSSHRYWGEREREEFLENIDNSVDRLSQILENSQEMSRLEIGAINLEQSPTEIVPLVERVLQHPTLQKHPGRFVLNLDDRMPMAEIDARRVEQALRNLLTTTLAYTPGDGKVQIGAKQEDKEIHFTISSRGGGIPEEHLKHLFDRFFQGDASNMDVVKGPSLALYVARGLIAAHGGRVWVENSNGRNTAIDFTLPLEARAPAARVAMATQRQPGGLGVQSRPTTQVHFEPTTVRNAGVRPPRERLKVLVVEDDPYMVRLLKINLESEGYTVVSATRGSTAIELANAEQPDIILLDVRLPDTDGFEVCARVREFNRIVPIIMITGKATDDDIVRGLQIGADDYMIKPLSHKELLARMHSLLQRAWMGAGEPQPEPVFHNGELMIDFAQRQVVAHGDAVKLTPTEYKMLYTLAINVGRVLTHEQLLLAVWGPGCEHQTQYLWVNISRLRGKLEVDPNDPQYIVTEQGIGYMMTKM
jgi:PAS domain S-box-containing protein